MKLMRELSDLKPFQQGVVATIGNFDGVHLGHQQLIKTLKKQAQRMNLPLVLILFEPQPREYFQKEKAPARLSTVREKIELLKECGVDAVYCVRFNQKTAETQAAEFANHLFSLLKVKYLLVGADFHFGKNREGDIALLQRIGAEHGAEVQVFADYTLSEEKVSSSKVRAALNAGDFARVDQYLGRPYSLSGRVLYGDQRGRQWSIPTANLSLHRVSLPLHGVFVVKVLRPNGEWVFGVANIGSRPTVDGTKNVLEIHLFDFNQSIYGELLRVTFLHKLRGEVKFDSVDALIAQIHDDIQAGKRFLHKTD